MTIRRSGPNIVDVNNERLTFEDEMTADDFIECLSHGDVESCSKEFPPEQTEYIGDEIGDSHEGSQPNPRANPIKDKRRAPTKPAPKKASDEKQG
jgi:hypothetical protein